MNHEENKAIAKESLPMNKTPNPTAPNDAPTTETAPPVEASHENSDTPKTPPPEFFRFMLNTLQQRENNQHRHRALNPESAQCDEGTKPYLILKDNQKVEDLERLLPHPARQYHSKGKNMTERTIYGQTLIEVDGADCTSCDLEFMSSECRAVRCCSADRSDGRAVVYKRKPDPQINTNPSLL